MRLGRGELAVNKPDRSGRLVVTSAHNFFLEKDCRHE